MGIGVDLTVDLGDTARRIDDEGVAARHVNEKKRPIRIVTLGDGATLISQQGKGQFEFLREAAVTLGAVETDANYPHA